jgi:glycosyltransferase involved in cell wall biosynthesis
MTRDLYVKTFGVPFSKIDVVTHLGVDTEHFRPDPSKRCPDSRRAVVGYCGRMDNAKGVIDLVEAVKLCRTQTGLSIELRLCGSGALFHDLEAMKGALDWLTVKPSVPNAEIADFMRELDVFVLPSRVLPDHQEHDAHALLEAMATGLPCIATRSGINPELLGDGTGVVVRPSDVADIAKALGELIENVRLRQHLGSQAREKALKEFDIKVVAHRKARIFQEMAE